MARVRLESGEFIEVPDDASQQQVQKLVSQANQAEMAQKQLALTAKDPRAPGPDPGVGGELMSQFLDPIVSLLTAGGKKISEGVEAVKSGDPMQMLSYGPKTIWDFLKGVGQAGYGNVREQVATAGKAVDALRGVGDAQGMPLSDRIPLASGYGMAAAVPIVGPQIARAGEQFGAGHFGAGAVDTANIMAQLFGPKATEEATAPIRSGGRSIYRDVLGFDPNTQVSPPISAIEEMAHRPEIRATPGRGTFDKLAEHIQKNLDIAEQEINKYPDLMIDTKQALREMRDKIYSDITSGYVDDPHTQALARTYKNFMDAVGGQINVPRAQELKQDVWSRLSNKDFRQSEAAKSGLTEAYLAKGSALKSAIEDVVQRQDPQSALIPANREAHTAIVLQDQLNKLSSENKSNLRRFLPYLAGAGALGAAETLGLGGSGALHMGLVGSEAALTAVAAKMAISDPVAMGKLAMFLSHVGEGTVSKLLANLPRVASGARAAQQSSQSGGNSGSVQ